MRASTTLFTRWAFALVVTVLAAGAVTAPPAGASSVEDTFTSRINKARASAGLPSRTVYGGGGRGDLRRLRRELRELSAATGGPLGAALEEMGEWDNTVFLFTSDNGATEEGGATGSRSYYKQFGGLAALSGEVTR